MSSCSKDESGAFGKNKVGKIRAAKSRVLHKCLNPGSYINNNPNKLIFGMKTEIHCYAMINAMINASTGD